MFTTNQFDMVKLNLPVDDNLQDVIKDNPTLMTDGEKSYEAVKNVTRKKFTSGLSKSKTHNLGRTDNIYPNLKNLMNGTFKRVATKYLEGYIEILKYKSNIFDNLIKITSSITEKKHNGDNVLFTLIMIA